MTKEELLRLSPGELTDLGICPTCFNRENGGALYGDLTDKMLYEDGEIECFFVGNPRAEGHMCISTVAHYHDMSEAPDEINEKIIRFASGSCRFFGRFTGVSGYTYAPCVTAPTTITTFS